MSACSACSGDYEDPDRTAWEAAGGELPEDRDEQGLHSEEFPAAK